METVRDAVGEILIEEDALQARIAELGQEISKAYEGRDLLLVGEREQRGACARVESLQQRQNLVSDQTALRARVGRVLAVPQPVLLAVGAGLLAPEPEQRPDDAVLAPRLDPLRRARGDEAEQH